MKMSTAETTNRPSDKLNQLEEKVNDILKKSIEIVDLRCLNIRNDLDFMREEFMQSLNKSIYLKFLTYLI